MRRREQVPRETKDKTIAEVSVEQVTTLQEEDAPRQRGGGVGGAGRPPRAAGPRAMTPPLPPPHPSPGAHPTRRAGPHVCRALGCKPSRSPGFGGPSCTQDSAPTPLRPRGLPEHPAQRAPVHRAVPAPSDNAARVTACGPALPRCLLPTAM